ncbi:NrfD/PsrC family molybdoenzyme membrane anchor subunit [Thiohalophilus sp.]|uniref:NrfD/PsrC family molybdoenzyme membrane anchor subunit n=1 Tax=Thiohalophilus sp. TaxID=3028392 RepID=UPI002ACD72E9|nr:NrfD/PsrC family molybdoenzyme membrane anchor subunit [Thiohalophilus sp.]MDZ7663336.1 NrfD/PsrC family molybdoenzyme membrane anchor subunit [Thiohalophilus sp.]
MINTSKSNLVFIVAIIGLIVTAALVLFNLVSQGHAAFNGSNLGLHWTFPIVVYDYFLLTSTGLAMIASLMLIFGGAHCQPLVRRCLWLAVAGLVGGVSVLALELGYPVRAIWAIPTSFAVTSPLWWKVMFVIAYVVVLLITVNLLRKPGEWPAAARTSAILLLLAALGVTGIAGVVYGSMTMRPFWSSGDVPVAFIFESLLGGLAFAIFFSYLAHGFSQERMSAPLRDVLTGMLPKVFALAIFVHLMFVGARALIGLYSNAEGLQVWQYLAGTSLFHIELWAGLVLPLLLMLSPGLRSNAGSQTLAALLVMISLFIARYDYIIGGQLVPMFKGAWAPELLSYAPSFTEWMLLLMAIFLANAIYVWGEKKFDLSWCKQA